MLLEYLYEVFAFLKKPENRKVISWVGGGTGAAVGFVLLIVNFFVHSPQERQNKTPSTEISIEQTGTTGSIAGEKIEAGRDLNIGKPPGQPEPDTASEGTANSVKLPEK